MDEKLQKIITMSIILGFVFVILITFLIYNYSNFIVNEGHPYVGGYNLEGEFLEQTMASDSFVYVPVDQLYLFSGNDREFYLGLKNVYDVEKTFRVEIFEVSENGISEVLANGENSIVTFKGGSGSETMGAGVSKLLKYTAIVNHDRITERHINRNYKVKIFDESNEQVYEVIIFAGIGR